MSIKKLETSRTYMTFNTLFKTVDFKWNTPNEFYNKMYYRLYVFVYLDDTPLLIEIISKYEYSVFKQYLYYTLR